MTEAITELRLAYLLSMTLFDGLEDSVKNVNICNNQLELKANISDVYYKNDLYTKSETNHLLNNTLKSSEISDSTHKHK